MPTPLTQTLHFPSSDDIVTLTGLLHENKSTIGDYELENSIRLLRVLYRYHHISKEDVYSNHFRIKLSTYCDFKARRIDEKIWTLSDRNCEW